MTLPAWPTDTVPHEPLRDTFQLVSHQAPLKTEMAGGNTRQRPQYTVQRATVAFVIKMTSAEHVAFRTFVITTINKGTSRFTMPVWGPAGCVSKTCQMTEPYKATPIAGGWSVSLTLEVEGY